MRKQRVRQKYKRARAGLVTSLMIAALASTSHASRAEIVVVAKKSFPLDSISKEQAAALWLGETAAVGKLKRIRVVDQKNDRSVTSEFREKVLEKTDEQVNIHWQKKMFSGKVARIRVVDSDQKVLKFVRVISGGVGYIDSASVNDDVKILLRVE